MAGMTYENSDICQYGCLKKQLDINNQAHYSKVVKNCLCISKYKNGHRRNVTTNKILSFCNQQAKRIEENCETYKILYTGFVCLTIMFNDKTFSFFLKCLYLYVISKLFFR